MPVFLWATKAELYSDVALLEWRFITYGTAKKMNNDCELLKLAAKSIGGVFHYNGIFQDKTFRLWNPLKFDGDALRLAVALNLCVTIRYDDTRVHQYESRNKKRQFHKEIGDPCAATRRAIVRAAAAIGGAM